MSDLRFWTLSSSSVYGNACLVQSGDTSLLVDCGVSLRRLERSLLSVGIAPPDLAGILITHEHVDHTRALCLKYPFPVRHEVPVYGTDRFWRCWESRSTAVPSHLAREVAVGEPIRVGSVTVTAFAKLHDAVDPVGFVVSDGVRRLGVVTDLGEVTPNVAAALRGCDYLLFESNHDVDMERASGRPPWLVQRVIGRQGHLSNEQAAAALSSIVTADTRAVVLGHLSCDCNLPGLAVRVVRSSLSAVGWTGRLMVAPAGDMLGCTEFAAG